MEKNELIKEFLQKANITNIHIYQGVLNGVLDINDEVVRNAVTQPRVYQELYKNVVTEMVEPASVTPEVPVEEVDSKTVEPEADDQNDSNDISFTVDGTEYIYKGNPNNTIATAFKNLKIKGAVYNGAETVNTKDAATTLAGLVLSKTKLETEAESSDKD